MSFSPNGPSRRNLLSLLAGWAASVAKAEPLRRIEPPRRSNLDPGLTNLLARMSTGVKARNYAALESLMLPTFRVEFDAGKGPVAFHRYWKPQSRDSQLWEILGRLLSMPGSAYSETLYAVSYVYARFPFDLDPLRHVVATGDSVDLLAEPSREARKVGALDYSIVPLAKPMEPPVVISPGQFLELAHPEFGPCFVNSSDVYHPSAHRAFFEKRQGRWYWISLAAATFADPPVVPRPS